MGVTTSRSRHFNLQGNKKSGRIKDIPVIKDKPLSLADAIQKNAGEAIVANYLSSKKYDIDEKDKHGNYFIHITIERGQMGVFALLLKYGCKLNEFNGLQQTPIMLAARVGNPGMLRELLTAGADVNVVNGRKEAPLHFAAMSGSLECVEIILKTGCQVNQKDKDGNTALMMACRINVIGVVQALLDAGADPTTTDDVYDRSVLHFASYFSQPSITTLLLDSGADIDHKDKNGDSSFVYAIKGKNVQTLTVLLQRGCDLYNMDGLNATPLGIACLSGYAPSVKALLDFGMDIDEVSSFGMTPLLIACYQSHVSVVHTLLENGADTGSSGRTGCSSIHISLLKIKPDNTYNRHEILKHLLRYNSDPNQVFSNVGFYSLCSPSESNPSITYAISSGYQSVVQLLLLGGVEIDFHEFCHWAHSGYQKCTCTVHRYEDIKELIEPVTDWFTAPRPLMHLCRAVIRKSLGNRVPKDIFKLPIASPLQKYIDFVEFDYITPKPVKMLSHFYNVSEIYPGQFGSMNMDSLEWLGDDPLMK